MEQRKKAFQEPIEGNGMPDGDKGSVVEIHSAEELTELLQQKAEDGTVVSVTVEVDGHA